MIILDFETRSEIDIKTHGIYRYMSHPSTRVLCAAYKIDNQATQIWAPWYDYIPYLRVMDPIVEIQDFDCPPSLQLGIESGGLIAAHNAAFEREVIRTVLAPLYGWPIPTEDQWVCTMAQAAYNGVPLGLKDVTKVLPLKNAKLSNMVMTKLCKPRPQWVNHRKGDKWVITTDLYDELCYYCIGDVEAESELASILQPLPAGERRIWAMTERMNTQGVPVDVDLVAAAGRAHDTRIGIACQTLSRVSGGQITSPTQVAKIIQWAGQQGHPITDLQQGTVDRLLADPGISGDTRAVIQARQSAGGAATAKFSAFSRRVSSDGYLRGEFCYGGAHTLRWTSKGVQMQNLPKNKMPVDTAEALIPDFIDTGSVPDMDKFLPTVVRSCITAPPGYMFIDYDYGQIEARMIAWMAEEEELLQSFRDLDTGKCQYDIYQQMAAEIYQIPVSQVTKQQRALGKVAILGLGYGMGIEKFWATAEDWGCVGVTLELSTRAVILYRKKYPKIVRLWYDFEKVVKRAIRITGDEVFGRYRILYDPKQEKMTIILANGRPLFYHQCKIVSDKIQYFGRLPPPRSGYGTVYAWGGKIAENIDQAQSRDILAQAMIRTQHLARIVLTIHDEVVWMASVDQAQQIADLIRDELLREMTWARGLPLSVGGWIARRMKKD